MNLENIKTMKKILFPVFALCAGALFAQAPKNVIFHNCTESHPYTEGLMLSIPRLETETIASELQRRGITGTQATDIARLANGSWLAALKKADETEENQQELHDFIALFRDAYTVGVLKDPQKKYDSLKRLRQWSIDIAGIGREKQKHFLQYAQQQVRENYIRNMNNPELNYQMEAERDFSVKFAPFIHNGNVEGIMNQLDLAERQIEQNGNAKMIFFDLCLQMIVLIKKPKQ